MTNILPPQKFLHLTWVLAVSVGFAASSGSAGAQQAAGEASVDETTAGASGEGGHSEADWLTLFDGTNLDHWRGYAKKDRPAGWVVEDGVLYRKSGGGDLVTEDAFGDFELTLEWKVAPGSNSGIIYRARLGDGAPYMSGLEYQVLDDAHGDAANLLTHAGSLYGLYPTDKSALRPAGEWNQVRILVTGNHVEHWLNGKQVVACDLWSDDWNERLKKSKFNGWKQFGRTTKGHIALQDHGDPVWYRNIQIREIKP